MGTYKTIYELWSATYESRYHIAGNFSLKYPLRWVHFLGLCCSFIVNSNDYEQVGTAMQTKRQEIWHNLYNCLMFAFSQAKVLTTSVEDISCITPVIWFVLSITGLFQCLLVSPTQIKTLLSTTFLISRDAGFLFTTSFPENPTHSSLYYTMIYYFSII